MSATAAAPPGLWAEGLSVRQGGRVVLHHVNLELRPGEPLAVVGPNGAGKSSLLRAMSGELPAASGAVRMEGRPLASHSALDLARRRAVLGQSLELSLPLTVAELASLGLHPHRLGPAAGAALVERALLAVDLAPLAGRSALALSGGERQRAHLARCLVQLWAADPGAPRFLLLDEPTSALDLRHQAGLLALARGLCAEGVGVLAVLHDLNLASAWADRLALLCGGALRALGPPEAVLRPSLLSCVWGCPLTLCPRPGGGPPLVLPPAPFAADPTLPPLLEEQP